jgi:hypothetical protein
VSSSRRIATTAATSLRPVAAPGRRDHGLLVQLIEEQLSPDHARLFAEPVPTPDGRSIDWYSEPDGPVTTLDRLEPGERDAAERELQRLLDDLRGLAERLAAGRDIDAQNKAQLLKAALEIPDLSYVRVIGGQPVLLAWSYVHDRGDAPMGVLGRFVASRAPPPAAAPAPAPVPAAVITSVPVAAPVVAGRRFGWLWWLLWLLFALLVALISWILLSEACGVRLLSFGLIDRCPAPAAAAAPVPALSRVVQREQQLQQEIQELERWIAQRQQQCRIEAAQATPAPEPPPPPAPRPAPPKPPPPPPQQRTDCPPADDMEKRLAEAGAQSGEVQVSLSWEGLADLDLAIVCPSGDMISFKDTEKRNCGGELDIDMNAWGSRKSQTPVENILWPSGGAAKGVYQVVVDGFDPMGDRRREVPFKIRVKVRGHEMDRQGIVSIRPRRQVEVIQFEVGDEPPPPPPASPECR